MEVDAGDDDDNPTKAERRHSPYNNSRKSWRSILGAEPGYSKKTDEPDVRGLDARVCRNTKQDGSARAAWRLRVRVCAERSCR